MRNWNDQLCFSVFVEKAWNKYNEGNWSEIIDEKIRQDCVESWQVLRCIEVGLLCSQYFARDRPKISLVVAQLQQETIEIQKPKRPAFYPIDEGKSGIPSSSNSKGESSTPTPYTVNRYTFSEIDARWILNYLLLYLEDLQENNKTLGLIVAGTWCISFYLYKETNPRIRVGVYVF